MRWSEFDGVGGLVRMRRGVPVDRGTLRPRKALRRRRRAAADTHSDRKGPGVDDSGRSYSSRDYNLRLLGFASYRAYLDSELWDGIRREVFVARGSVCTLCPERATELHHGRYHRSDLTGLTRKHIHPICRGCHDKIEIRDDRTKRPLEEVVQEFRRLLGLRSIGDV